MKAGDLYKHYKGGEYVIIAVSILESSKGTDKEQTLITYQSLEKNQCWTRTLENFTEVVDVEDKTMLRFEPVGAKIIFLDQYQEAALRTAGSARNDKIEALNVTGLGVAGEAGEVADMVKKHLFHKHPLDELKFEKELGDVLWYEALGAHAIKRKLSDVATTNIKKLIDRYPDGFSKERSLNRESA
jgi:NTP pyrophosphatase (non-canonical NTP hydrolase)